MRRSLAILAALFVSFSAHAQTKMKVAVLVHAPGVKGAADVGDELSSALLSDEFAVLSRRALLKHLTSLAGATVDPLAALREKVAQADRKYLDLDLDGADALLKEAESALTPLLADPEAAAMARTILEKRALVLLTAGRTDPATEKLNALYVLDPEYRPDARLLAPQFAPAFEKARNATAIATRGSLVVSSVPAGADVYVDGRWIGVTPATADLRTGQHIVQVRHADFAPAGAIVSIGPGDRNELPMKLAPMSDAERHRVRAREAATATLSGPRRLIADEIRAITGASAVVFAIERATSDGPRLSVEVYRADQPTHTSKSQELPLSGASTIAREATRLLQANAILENAVAAPVFATRKVVKNPLLIDVRFGPKLMYGTGWRHVDGVGGSADLGGSIAFRLEESSSNVMDIVVTAGTSNPKGCLPVTIPCTDFQLDILSFDIAPRLVIPVVSKLSLYAQVGVGAASTTYRITAPGQEEKTSGIVAVSAHGAGGFTYEFRRRVRLGLEGRIAVADAPSPLFQDTTGVAALNVGGAAMVFTAGSRF